MNSHTIIMIRRLASLCVLLCASNIRRRRESRNRVQIGRRRPRIIYLTYTPGNDIRQNMSKNEYDISSDNNGIGAIRWEYRTESGE